MKRLLPFLIVVAVALITAVAGFTLYRAKRPELKTIPEDTVNRVADSASLHVRGRTDAPVTVEEFGDFQCPPCGAMSGPLLEIEKEFGTKLRVIFRHFPFDVHQHARAASYAAEAADLQGKFWEMHDLLYREQGSWSQAPDADQIFESYARSLGMDVERYRRDISSSKVRERIAADQERGRELGVRKTPTLFVNNRELPPTSLNPDGVRSAINDALKEIPAR